MHPNLCVGCCRSLLPTEMYLLNYPLSYAYHSMELTVAGTDRSEMNTPRIMLQKQFLF